MSHLVPKKLVAMPFVDGAPDPTQRPDQRRIEWVRNGECLGGAERITDNSGELNRGPVQVQANVDTINANTGTIEASLIEVITRVNSHDDALGQIGDDNLANKVETLEETVSPMAESIVGMNLRLERVSEISENTKTEVGDRDQDDNTTRKVMGDLYFVKKQIGNWQDKDVNENDVPGTDATGLKFRIVNQGLSIASNSRRITKLEEDWAQSDVSALDQRIDDIRDELGRSGDVPALGVYKWIDDANNKHGKYEAEILALQEDIGQSGGQTLSDRIEANRTNIEANKAIIDRHENNITDLQTVVGDDTQAQSVVGRLTIVERTAGKLNTIVGDTENDGMRKKVQDVVDEIGNEAMAASIKGRMTGAERNITTNQRDISAIKLQIGSSTSGEQTGIYRSINNLNNAVLAPSTGLVDIVAGLEIDKLEEAPEDGKTYARSDGDWVEIQQGSRMVEEAPDDGGNYIRYMNTWKKENSDDIVAQPTKKFSVMVDPDTTKDAIQYTNNSITFGDASQPLSLAGALENIKVKNEFKILNSSGKEILVSKSDELIVGATHTDNIATILRGDLKAEVGGVRYAVWHSGNFTDNETNVPMVRVNGRWNPLLSHIPVRSMGGFYTNNAGDGKATSVTTGNYTTVEFGDDPKDLPNRNFTSDTSSIKYTGEAGVAMQVQVDMRLMASAATEVEFELYKNDVGTGKTYTIEADQWSASKRANVSFMFPQTVSKDDTFTIRALAKADVTINVKSGTLYAFEI